MKTFIHRLFSGLCDSDLILKLSDSRELKILIIFSEENLLNFSENDYNHG